MQGTPLDQEWLTSLHGVGEATAEKLTSRFDTLEKLAGAEPNRTAGDLKASRLAVQKAVLAAREMLKTHQEQMRAGAIEAPDTSRPDEDEEWYVVRRIPIDRFTQKAERVLVTPSVCTICGYDAAKKMGAKDWDDLDEPSQATARRVLTEHTKFHAPGEARLLRKSELPTMNLKPIG